MTGKLGPGGMAPSPSPAFVTDNNRQSVPANAIRVHEFLIRSGCNLPLAIQRAGENALLGISTATAIADKRNGPHLRDPLSPAALFDARWRLLNHFANRGRPC